MERLVCLALILLLCLWAHLGDARPHRHSATRHRIFAAPRRFSRIFLERYAKKAVDEANKMANGQYKYVLLDVIGGRAIEETKTLEIVAKFGRTRCQKTEDRYFCQTTPAIRLEEKIFKVDIRKKAPEASIAENAVPDNAAAVEFKFEETPESKLPAIKKLLVDTINP